MRLLKNDSMNKVFKKNYLSLLRFKEHSNYYIFQSDDRTRSALIQTRLHFLSFPDDIH